MSPWVVPGSVVEGGVHAYHLADRVPDDPTLTLLWVGGIKDSCGFTMGYRQQPGANSFSMGHHGGGAATRRAFVSRELRDKGSTRRAFVSRTEKGCRLLKELAAG